MRRGHGPIMQGNRKNVMAKEIPKILFDNRDYELLGLVNDVLDHKESLRYLKNLLYPYLHPRGIKELAARPVCGWPMPP